MRTRWIGRCVKILLVSALLSAASPGSAFDAGSPACESPGHRQFDFWAGDWDAYDADAPGTRSARVRVDVILDGCALREIYEGADGLVGQSFSIYDASRKVWHQTWVTNRGQLLALEGEYRDGRMTLRATETTPTGPVLWRGVWGRQGDGVRETAETSPDGGRTWKPRFDIFFRPHRAP